jgi:protease II
MGTKKSSCLTQDHYRNLELVDYHTERISVKMRDDFEIPVVIKYNKKHYSEDSPWVLFTRGIKSSKDDTNWNRNDLALMSRGIVCAYPLLRGKFLQFY